MKGRLPVASFIAMGLAMAVAYAAAPSGAASEALYNAVPVAAAAAWILALRRRGPGPAASRAFQTAGLGLVAAGELAYWWAMAGGSEPSRAVTDPLYLAGTVLAAVGLLRRPPRRARADPFETIDTAIFTVAVGALLWLAVVVPVLQDGRIGGLDQVWALASPLADVLLVAGLARAWFSGHTDRPDRLLDWGWGAFLVADFGFQIGQHVGTYTEGNATDLAFMVGYTLLGAAALGQLGPARPERERSDMSALRRLVVVCVGALVPPAAVLVGVAVVRPVSVAALAGPGAATLVTFVLTIIRMSTVVVSVESRTAEAAEARLHALVEHSTDVIAVVDLDARMRYLSPAFRAVLGRDVDRYLGAPLTAIVHPDDAVRLATHVVDTAVGPATTTARFETRLLAADGTVHEFEVVASRLAEGADGEGVALTMRDISERNTLAAQLSHQAFHDSLTGLPNRARFSDRVDRALRRAEGEGRSVAVAFIDLDDFKAVNDGLGHGAGDTLLRSVAERIDHCVRADDIAARLGGDEFALLLVDGPRGSAGPADAEAVAHRILAALRAPVRIEGMDLSVVASIGVAWADAGSTTEGLLRDADIAMYEAKRTGKGRVCVFDPGMRERASDRLALQRDVALAVERGEMRVVYQPIVDLRTGLATEAEALLRWHHPTRGEVPPSTFVSVAERTGVVDVLGRWVLEEACAHAAVTGGGVSVNVSAVQFGGASFLRDVAGALSAAALPATRLTIEITETTLMADTEAAASMLEELRGLGVRVAIDDFGTGYCSLAYLHRFAVDVVKIDRAFVVDLDGDGRGDVLVRAILQLGASLGVPRIVAEGIETERQLERLVELGCPFGQGFLLAGPMEDGAHVALVTGHVSEGAVTPDDQARELSSVTG